MTRPAMSAATLFDVGEGPVAVMPAVRKTALISPCGRYRYELGREWGGGGRFVNFVMVNPSRADADIDDNTITRCIGFARSWGYDGIRVTNLYAFRATDIDDLWKTSDRIGPDNDSAITLNAHHASLVVCAWGAKPKADHRIAAVLNLLASVGARLHVLRLTKGGYPEHPLMLPKDLTPMVWSPSR